MRVEFGFKSRIRQGGKKVAIVGPAILWCVCVNSYNVIIVTE